MDTLNINNLLLEGTDDVVAIAGTLLYLYIAAEDKYCTLPDETNDLMAASHDLLLISRYVLDRCRRLSDESIG